MGEWTRPTEDTNMSSITTFIAVDMAPVIKAAAKKQIRALEKITSGYRWDDVQTLFLTLKQLGKVEDREIPDLCRYVEGAVKASRIFDIDFRGLGAFPSLDRPRTIWMGIEDVDGAFATLQRNLDDVLSDKMGFQPEKKEFKAHLSLGRSLEPPQPSRELKEYLEQSADVEFGSMEVDQVIIYSMFTKRGPTTYTPMATIDLEA